MNKKSNVTNIQFRPSSYLILIDDRGYLAGFKLTAIDGLQIGYTKLKSESFVYDSLDSAMSALSFLGLFGSIRELSTCQDLTN